MENHTTSTATTNNSTTHYPAPNDTQQPANGSGNLQNHQCTDGGLIVVMADSFATTGGSGTDHSQSGSDESIS